MECGEHFRNICESVAQEYDNENETFTTELGKEITIDLNRDPRQSESSMMGDVDESTTPISMPLSTTMPTQKKKKKKRIPPSYLAPTAASKAMKRDKSPLAGKTLISQKEPNVNESKNRFETSPSTRAKTITPHQPGSNFYRTESAESSGLSSQWIEDLPLE